MKPFELYFFSVAEKDKDYSTDPNSANKVIEEMERIKQYIEDSNDLIYVDKDQSMAKFGTVYFRCGDEIAISKLVMSFPSIRRASHFIQPSHNFTNAYDDWD